MTSQVGTSQPGTSQPGTSQPGTSQPGTIATGGAASDVAAHREWLCSLVDCGALGAQADGERYGALLDVGCGDGADLRAIAAQVPHAAVRSAGSEASASGRQAARFVGIDGSAAAIERARLTAAVRDSGVAAQDDGAAAVDAGRRAGGADDRIAFLEHRIGDSLPFEDGAFDVVFSHNFLECVGDKVALLREVARVLRPGGQVVCAHWDWDSQTFDGADKELVRRVVHAFADWQQPWMEHCDGWMGRRLWRTFQSTGWFEGTIYARVMTNTVYAPPWYGHARLADCAALAARGMIGGDDYRRLIENIEQQAAADRYFYSITGYAYVGRKTPDAILRQAGPAVIR